ncbi:MAG: low molecular weight protein arginine phosphatase [Gemmatimonadales bacterium]|nr:MAG: low molecular weight protein arginine phosphatase [Gemmatimonadales bacterium]
MRDERMGGESEVRGEPFRILFVCTGNTCRSPMAEAIARAALRDRGWDHVTVESAGVAAFPGAPISGGAVRAAARHGIELDHHRSSPLTEARVEDSNLILTMSPSHLQVLVDLGAEGRSAVLPVFARGETKIRPGDGVQDPIGGDDALYEATFRELRELIESALNRLAPMLSPER